jgi:soluble lytic murein transglycosylase-like protein
MSFTQRIALMIPSILLSMVSVTVILMRLASGLTFTAAGLAILERSNNSSGDQAMLASASSAVIQMDCSVSDGFPAPVHRWCALITHYAHQYSLSPNLVAALILQESGGDPEAYSRNGAVGLMQVMPRDGLAASFMCANGPCFQARPSSQELRDPEFNIAFGTRYLAGLVSRHGNLRDALKSYGPVGIDYYYADKVLSIYNTHQAQ